MDRSGAVAKKTEPAASTSGGGGSGFGSFDFSNAPPPTDVSNSRNRPAAVTPALSTGPQNTAANFSHLASVAQSLHNPNVSAPSGGFGSFDFSNAPPPTDVSNSRNRPAAAAAEPQKEEPKEEPKAAGGGGFGGGGFGSFDFSSAPEPTDVSNSRNRPAAAAAEPQKEEPKEEPMAAGGGGFGGGGFGSFDFSSAPEPVDVSRSRAVDRSGAVAKKTEPAASTSGGGGGGGFASSFSFGGAPVESVAATSAARRSAGTSEGEKSVKEENRKSLTRDQKLLGVASLEETNTRMANISFDFNFSAAAEPEAGGSDAAGANDGTANDVSGFGGGFAFGEDAGAAFSTAAEAAPAPPKAAEPVAEAAPEPPKAAEPVAEAAPVAPEPEEVESDVSVGIVNEVSPEWKAKVEHAKTILEGDLPDEDPQKVAARVVVMEEAERIMKLLADSDDDDDDGVPEVNPYDDAAVVSTSVVADPQPEEPVAHAHATEMAEPSCSVSKPDYTKETPEAWQAKVGHAKEALASGAEGDAKNEALAVLEQEADRIEAESSASSDDDDAVSVSSGDADIGNDSVLEPTANPDPDPDAQSLSTPEASDLATTTPTATATATATAETEAADQKPIYGEEWHAKVIAAKDLVGRTNLADDDPTRVEAMEILEKEMERIEAMLDDSDSSSSEDED